MALSAGGGAQSCLDLLVSSGHSSCPQCRDDVAGVGSLEAVLGSVLQVSGCSV